MAERRALPPPVPPPASPDPASASSAVSTAFGSPLEPVAALPPPPRAPHDTYVVKVQKDQIYRVPPPENAYLAERYRTERAGKAGSASSSSCTPCVLRTLGALLAAAVLVAAAVAISVVVLRPGLPSFSVDGLSVSVHNASSSSQPQQQRVDYDVFLTAVNPNKMSALWYRNGGTARLLHRGAVLAKGVLGEPADGGEDATDFTVVLHGAIVDGVTPKAVRKGLHGARDAVALQLTVEATVQVHIGALGFGQRRLVVDCHITAPGLRKGVHVSSQECKSTFVKN